MRVKTGPISDEEAREIFEGQLEHYLAGGELLPTCCGLSGEIDGALARVAGILIQGDDPAEAVAAAWAAFHELHPE